MYNFLRNILSCLNKIDITKFILVFTFSILLSCSEGLVDLFKEAQATIGVNSPTFNYAAGSYNYDIDVVLTCSTSGTTIYYTTDNTPPTDASTVYSGSVSVYNHLTNLTIRAIAEKDDIFSGEVIVVYNIDYDNVVSPTFSLTAGTYTGSQTVDLSTTTSSATIKYTTDDTDPVVSGTAIIGTSVTVDQSMTIRAYAYKTGMADSDISDAVYTINGSMSWTHPSGLSDNLSPNECSVYSGMGDVAVSDNGTAVTAGVLYCGSKFDIYMSEYDGSSWSIPAVGESISIPSENSYYPDVAMDDEGNGIIVWQQSDGTRGQIFVSTKLNGAADWTVPSGLLDNISPDTQVGERSSVAMTNNGEAVIVWSQIDSSSNYQVARAEYRFSGTWDWTYPVDEDDYINTYSENASGFGPVVAMGGSGDAVIAWDKYNGTYDQLYQSINLSGSWDGPPALNEYLSNNNSNLGSVQCPGPAVAMSDNGEAVIIWLEQDGVSETILYMTEYRGVSWSAPQAMSFAGGRSYSADVSMNATGDSVIVWEQQDYNDGDYYHVYKAEYRSGGPWTGPSGIDDHISPDSAFGGTNDRSPQAAIADNGDAVIVWNQDTTSNDRLIFKCEYRSGGPWAVPTSDINPDSGGTETRAYYPHVDMASDGFTVITFEQNDGVNNSGNSQVFASFYD